MLTEAQLRAFWAGDAAFFEGAVRNHSPRLKAYARGYVHDDSTAEDVVQEVWLAAYRRRETFQGDGSFLGWLLAISRTAALDHLRDLDREEVRLTRARQNNGGCASDPCVSDAGGKQIDRIDRAHRLRDAMADLPPRQRDTVVLRVLEDQSVQETAKAMKCAPGTVKAALHKALENLRKTLLSDGSDP